MKATINTMRAEVATVKASMEKSNQNYIQTRPNGKKINLHMLNLLETLTQVSTQQQRQINTMNKSMQKKRPNLNQLWSHVSYVTNVTEDRLDALSQKVEHCLVQVSQKETDKLTPVQDNSDSKEGSISRASLIVKPLLKVVDGVINVTQRLTRKLIAVSVKPSSTLLLNNNINDNSNNDINVNKNKNLPSINLQPLMGHIDDLSKGLHHQTGRPKMSSLTKEALNKLQQRIKSSIEALRQWKARRTRGCLSKGNGHQVKDSVALRYI